MKQAPTDSESGASSLLVAGAVWVVGVVRVVFEWMSEWVSERVSEWASEWVSYICETLG